jgi:AbrB family looped-hinge helix DNA binding protein
MAILQSKMTEEGQISVPAEIRQKFGIGPGSVLEWREEGDHLVLRKAGGYTFEDIHRALFPTPPEPRTLEEMKEGISRYVRRKYARRWS